MFQSLTIIGNLGKDPETRTTQSGKTVTNFSVAVSEMKAGEKSTTWFKATCWDRSAEIADQYLRKGGKVMLMGRVGIETWETKDGETRADLTITVNQLVLLGDKGSEGGDRPRREEEPRRGGNVMDERNDRRSYRQQKPREEPVGDGEDTLPF